MRKNNNTKIIYILLFMFFCVSVFFFREKYNLLLNKSVKFFKLTNDIENLSTNENIVNLQNQIKILQEENKNLNITLQNGSNTKKEVALNLIGSKSSIYGNFWTEINENISKTELKKNIEVGTFVFGQENVLVGKISEIRNNNVKVTFLGSDEAFLAEILESKENIELKGSGVGLYFAYISKNANINLGDLVIKKGNEKAIIGNIVDINEEENSLKKIWIRTPYNIKNLEKFYVLFD
jgi:hypothetical protein